MTATAELDVLADITPDFVYREFMNIGISRRPGYTEETGGMLNPDDVALLRRAQREMAMDIAIIKALGRGEDVVCNELASHIYGEGMGVEHILMVRQEPGGVNARLYTPTAGGLGYHELDGVRSFPDSREDLRDILLRESRGNDHIIPGLGPGAGLAVTFSSPGREHFQYSGDVSKLTVHLEAMSDLVRIPLTCNDVYDRVDALYTIAQKGDGVTGERNAIVGECAAYFAEEMELSSTFCENLKLAAPHHDIGKIGKPMFDQVTNGKPIRDRDSIQWQIIEFHALFGYLAAKATLRTATGDSGAQAHYLAQVEEYQDLIHTIEVGALSHHMTDVRQKDYPPSEMVDLEMPLSARIFALVDVFTALASPTPRKYQVDGSQEYERRSLEDVFELMRFDGGRTNLFGWQRFGRDVWDIFEQKHVQERLYEIVGAYTPGA